MHVALLVRRATGRVEHVLDDEQARVVTHRGPDASAGCAPPARRPSRAGRSRARRRRRRPGTDTKKSAGSPRARVPQPRGLEGGGGRRRDLGTVGHEPAQRGVLGSSRAVSMAPLPPPTSTRSRAADRSQRSPDGVDLEGARRAMAALKTASSLGWAASHSQIVSREVLEDRAALPYGVREVAPRGEVGVHRLHQGQVAEAARVPPPEDLTPGGGRVPVADALRAGRGRPARGATGRGSAGPRRTRSRGAEVRGSSSRSTIPSSQAARTHSVTQAPRTIQTTSSASAISPPGPACHRSCAAASGGRDGGLGSRRRGLQRGRDLARGQHPRRRGGRIRATGADSFLVSSGGAPGILRTKRGTPDGEAV